MCRAVEELIDEEKLETTQTIILELLKSAKLSLEEIASACGVSVEFVEKIKATMNGAA